ncbi:MAG: hypothetical protein AB7K09_23140 [Planctomycetota bacterium]
MTTRMMMTTIALALVWPGVLMTAAPAALVMAQDEPGRMGDPGMQPEPADPPPTMPTKPDGDGNGSGDMGPFHRDNPGHNPDADRMGQRGPDGPDIRVVVDVVSAGLGLEGETAAAFKKLLVGSDTATKEANAANQAENQRIGNEQRNAVATLLTPAQTEQVYRLVSALERYKQQLAQLTRAGLANPRVAEQRKQLDAAADTYLRQEFGDERGAVFSRFLVAAAARGEIPQGPLVEQIGNALDLPAASIVKLQLISTGTRRLQARNADELRRRLEAIREKQRAGLEELLTPAQYLRLGRIHMTSEGYKAAMADLDRAARQPGVTREALAEQRRKIEETALNEFRQLIEPAHLERFIELWRSLQGR